MRIVHVPRIDTFRGAIAPEVGRQLARAGLEIVEDAVRRIHAQVDLQGAPQKQNAPGTRRWKLSHLGHAVPLRMRDVLSHPAEWLVNGAPATSMVARGGMRATVEVPPSRQQVVLRLRAMGYRVPFGPVGAGGWQEELVAQAVAEGVRRAAGRAGMRTTGAARGAVRGGGFGLRREFR